MHIYIYIIISYKIVLKVQISEGTLRHVQEKVSRHYVNSVMHGTKKNSTGYWVLRTQQFFLSFI